mmetsp:Transcript_14445/g.42328  ORF Transcript_14445/g.42328 Transcript_14445/m.42328 type:complete len:103 (-) Transcript_14445:162-470(-)
MALVHLLQIYPVLSTPPNHNLGMDQPGFSSIGSTGPTPPFAPHSPNLTLPPFKVGNEERRLGTGGQINIARVEPSSGSHAAARTTATMKFFFHQVDQLEYPA